MLWCCVRRLLAARRLTRLGAAVGCISDERLELLERKERLMQARLPRRNVSSNRAARALFATSRASQSVRIASQRSGCCAARGVDAQSGLERMHGFRRSPHQWQEAGFSVSQVSANCGCAGIARGSQGQPGAMDAFDARGVAEPRCSFEAFGSIPREGWKTDSVSGGGRGVRADGLVSCLSADAMYRGRCACIRTAWHAPRQSC